MPKRPSHTNRKKICIIFNYQLIITFIFIFKFIDVWIARLFEYEYTNCNRPINDYMLNNLFIPFICFLFLFFIIFKYNDADYDDDDDRIERFCSSYANVTDIDYIDINVYLYLYCTTIVCQVSID